jgi:hypothetical protein
MLGHCFHRLVLVGTKGDALPIRKHESLMMANFRDDAFGHSALRRATHMIFWWSRVLSKVVAGNTCGGFLESR